MRYIIVTKVLDYTKKKQIQLITSDGSEFLFQAANRENLEEWQQKLDFNSNLKPSESVKKSSLVRMSGIPPDPWRPEDLPLEERGGEPLYTNIAAAPHNSKIENQSENNGSQQNDNDRKLIENLKLTESVKKSALVRMSGICPDPWRPKDLPLEEPLCTNIAATSYNSDIENQPKNNGSQENDDDRKLIENSKLISVELSKLVD